MNLNIAVFHDTQIRLHNDPELLSRTRASVEATRIYEEGFQSLKNPWHSDYRNAFQEVLPLRLAQEFSEAGLRVAIVNAAHAALPGGNILTGGDGAEEYLCRATSLYNCLKASHVRAFYEQNLDSELPLQSRILPFSDRVIYSPGVVVVREDSDFYPGFIGRNHQVPLKNWYTVDVQSCTPPLCGLETPPNDHPELMRILKKRLCNILEIAIDHEIDALIFGAFGCGQFFIPPELAAEAICDLLHTLRYRRAFRHVVTAVARTEYDRDSMFAFQKRFPTRIPSPKYRPLGLDDYLSL